MPRARALAPLVFLVWVVASCKVKAQSGSGCTSPGKFVCVEKDTALYCDKDTYMPVACRGPRGCVSTTTADTCDDILAEEGEVCVQSDNHACSVDHKRALVCKDGRWALWHACKGAEACTVQAKSVHCDSSIADLGDACIEHGKGACSTDKRFLLVCTERDCYERDSSCRGPEACHLSGKHALCDDSVALEADPCDTPDERTCTTDGKSQLICKAGKFVKERDCKAKCIYTTSRDPPRCDY